MKNKSPFVQLTVPADQTSLNTDKQSNYLSERMLVMRNMQAIDRRYIPQNQPILTREYRLIRILHGEMLLTVNMRPYHLQKDMLLVTTPQSILEIGSQSEDFDMYVVAYRNLSPLEAYSQTTLLQASDTILQRIDQYINLLGAIVHNPQWQDDTARHILIALFADLHSDRSVQMVSNTNAQGGRKAQLFDRFLELLAEFCGKERRISVFAERLCLSPNRLSAVIKEYSGQTVMEWINRSTLQQAKVLLRFSDDPIYSVGWQLGFENPAYFAKFFHRETGITPKEYREGK